MFSQVSYFFHSAVDCNIKVILMKQFGNADTTPKILLWVCSEKATSIYSNPIASAYEKGGRELRGG